MRFRVTLSCLVLPMLVLGGHGPASINVVSLITTPTNELTSTPGASPPPPSSKPSISIPSDWTNARPSPNNATATTSTIGSMRTTPLETIVFPATSATPPPLTSESEEPTTLDRTKPPIPLGQGSPDIGVMNNLLPASVAFVGMTLCLVVVVYFHHKRRMRDDQTRQPWLDSPSGSPTMTVKHTDSPSATSIAPYHPSLDTRNLCNDDESSCVVDPWFESGISSLASMDVDTTRFMEMVHMKVHVHALSNA